MKTLNISKKTVLDAYRTEELREKQLLEKLFGAEIFSEKVTDRIKTLQDAIEETGRPEVPAFSDVPEDLRPYFQEQYKAIVVTEALNEGWEADYNDGNQKKWMPWLKASLSGFAFGDTYCVRSDPAAGRAARLCLKSDELAAYVGKQFTDIHAGIITK
ncbi:MAG: hypothetical protein LBI82_05685 [Dysgonamonadaceae bacterium]|jgi:hypothetical protein|nr:hypothetical protein [Dysgonamonadaceae bacterium]